MIADAFRRHGYRVREVGGRGRADGGVDVVLHRASESTIVQAKHWRRDRVGVTLVRELYGVQRAMQAQHSVFVAMGSYTADATQFAAQVGMTLVDGEELLRIIGTGLRGESLELPTPTAVSAPALDLVAIPTGQAHARREEGDGSLCLLSTLLVVAPDERPMRKGHSSLSDVTTVRLVNRIAMASVFSVSAIGCIPRVVRYWHKVDIAVLP